MTNMMNMTKKPVTSKTLWGLLVVALCTMRSWLGMEPLADAQLESLITTLEQVGQVLGWILAFIGRLVAGARIELPGRKKEPHA